MEMKTITVFTPTYNRAYILGQLYESLTRQTSKDFCWLIVDDGSTDNTKELIETWTAEGLLDIRYYYQENGGKMRAHNYGVTLCDTELFLCCDSDDYLVDNAVELIINKWKSYKGDKEIISGLICPSCVYKNGIKIRNVVPQGEQLLSYREFSTEKGNNSEAFLIYRTDILKQYPYPVIDGEKFFPEGFTHSKISDKYKMIVITDELVICQYMPDGYSMNDIKHFVENPKSMIIVENEAAYRNGFRKSGIIAASNYIIASMIGKKSLSEIFFNSRTKILTMLLFPISLIRWKNIIRKYNKT